MKVEVCYVFPVAAPQYHSYAERFVASCVEHPASIEYHTTIVCNGGSPDLESRALFSLLPNVKFLLHDNSGYDIGGYQAASRESDANMIVFFGASAYVRKPGWLLHMVAAWKRHGDTQYGSMANRGDGRFSVFPHLRTTGFWTTPALFNAYPLKVTRPDQRHPFEHGPGCFSQWIQSRGMHNWLVTSAGDYLWAEWDNAPGGFHRDAQENLLSGDHLSEPPFYHCA